MEIGPLGCVIDQRYTEATCAALEESGLGYSFADGPGISGQWQKLVDRGVTGVYLWKDEHERLGDPGADYQKRGTCFPAGAQVMMKEGVTLPIEQVRAGDEVLTHYGQFQKVLAVGARPYSGNMVSVRFRTKQGHDNVICTPDHEFCILPYADAPIDACLWIQACDLILGQCLVVPHVGGRFGWDTARVTEVVNIDTANVATDVYSLDVEEDESFTVNSIAVHNCVGRGTYRAIQQSYHAAITSGTLIGVPTEIAYEPIYYGSREIIGKGRLGSGDGSVGSWAAEWVSKYGIIPRGVYGNLDFSDDNESWAVSRRKLPQSLIDLGKMHTVAAHLCKTWEETCDALASEFAIARCHNTIYGQRDRNGESKPRSNGAHCQAQVGIYLRPDRTTGIIEQQSWGDCNPSGTDILQTAGGPVQLPPGCYGITEDSWRKATRGSRWWEAWAFSVRAGEGFRTLPGGN